MTVQSSCAPELERCACLLHILPMSIAENLHRLRVTDGKTIEDIADAARLSPALVASIENGRPSVPQKAIRALAAHFGISVDQLLR